MTLALVYTARCLRRYFRNHKIKVVIEGLTEHALRNPRVLGRLALWAVELGVYNISYVPRDTIKGHVAEDFLADGKQEYKAPGESNKKKQGNIKKRS
ncbi:hypothetical protein Tco_1275757 [Tanacetum coccineum]